MLVWNSDSPDITYNPGEMDPYTGRKIDDALGTAIKAAPEGSAARERLQESRDFFAETTRAMDRADYKTWWEPPDDDSQESGVDLTITGGNTHITDSILPCVARGGRNPIQCGRSNNGSLISS